MIILAERDIYFVYYERREEFIHSFLSPQKSLLNSPLEASLAGEARDKVGIKRFSKPLRNDSQLFTLDMWR